MKKHKPHHPKMLKTEMIAETRRKNLREALEHIKTGVERARLLEIEPSYLTQIIGKKATRAIEHFIEAATKELISASAMDMIRNSLQHAVKMESKGDEYAEAAKHNPEN